MIEAAVILSGVVQHWPDFFIILVLLFSNAVVGFWEERQAGNAIAALKAKLAITSQVKRDGKMVTKPASELVPGNVIHVRLGDVVPADARLLDGDPVEVDQSALTALQFALVLIVAAIPVAIPTVLSVTMAVGARLLAKNKRSSVGWRPSRSWRAWTFCAPTRREP